VDRPSWATDDVDLSRPSVARVYDYFLGGSHHFEVDRQMAAQLLQMAPDMPDVMRTNRSFLRRAVQYMVDRGITQFLDIGSGIPTVGNVHEIAQAVNPQARVVYVDKDPVAVAHGRHVLADNRNAAVIAGDLATPDHILDAPETRRLLDLDEPVGLLCVAVLHFLAEADNPYAAMATLRAAIAPDSYLAISHGMPGRPETDEVKAAYTRASPLTERTPEQIASFFGDFELVAPGLVYPTLWRPSSPDDVDEHPERAPGLVGMGRKR
jgi:S-adenosyl methyltransferase